MKFLAVEIPIKLHTDFKTWCAKNGTTMRAEIIRMIRELIYREDNHG